MTIAPVLPFAGYAGWRYLQRTLEDQQARVASSATHQRDEAYFRDRIGTVTTAEDLVGDRRLLKVALGAFGLDDDIGSKAFIRKVLEGGTASGSLASRLSNKAYAQLSAAFGFDGVLPKTLNDGFADGILAAYSERRFEVAVGEQNNDLRLALNAQRELSKLAAGSSSDNTKWYTIMGSTPLRNVFETAFGLPDAFGTLDIDRQLTMLKQKAETYLGSSAVTQFTDPDRVEELVKLFTLRSTATATSATSPALTLLQGTGSAGSLFQYLIR